MVNGGVKRKSRWFGSFPEVETGEVHEGHEGQEGRRGFRWTDFIFGLQLNQFNLWNSKSTENLINMFGKCIWFDRAKH